jgi:HEAT repeat protein
VSRPSGKHLCVALGLMAVFILLSFWVFHDRLFDWWYINKLDARDEEKRVFAINRLADRKSIFALRPVLRLLPQNEIESHSKTWDAALVYFGAMGKTALPELAKSLCSRQWWIRYSALVAIGRVGFESAQDVLLLKGALKDERPEIRNLAITLVGELGGRAATLVADVIELTDDGSGEIRLQAFGALGNLGVYSEEVILTLKRGAVDQSEGVREAAIKSLGLLEQRVRE